MSMLSKLSVAASILDQAVKKFFFDLLKVDTVAAAGSLISDATVLKYGRNMVTAANGTKAVRLPKSEPDSKVEVVNTSATQALIVFPELAADQINAITAGASLSMPGGSSASFYCDAAGHWYAAVATASTADTAELAYLDIATLGTGAASKAVVLDADGNYIMPDNGMFGLSRAAVAAAGTDATNATALTDQVNAVTGADGTAGVALPAAAVTSGPIYVINTVLTSGADLKVYPVNGGNDNINSGAEDAAFVMGPGKAAWFIPTSATQWYVEDAAGVLTTKAEANLLDGSTAGTAVPEKAAVLGTDKELDEVHTAALYLGVGAGTLVASTAAQIDAAVAGTPLVYRTNVTAAEVNAGTTAVVPAVAGKRFQVMHISMAANGGDVSGPTTVEVVEETAGTVFLSHVTADLTNGTWHNLVSGTPVITGMTAGGMTSTDNKALIVTKTGGTDFATATSLDVIVVGYYTTT